MLYTCKKNDLGLVIEQARESPISMKPTLARDGVA